MMAKVSVYHWPFMFLHRGMALHTDGHRLALGVHMSHVPIIGLYCQGHPGSNHKREDSLKTLQSLKREVPFLTYPNDVRTSVRTSLQFSAQRRHRSTQVGMSSWTAAILTWQIRNLLSDKMATTLQGQHRDSWQTANGWQTETTS
jgi:hypothetical protein